MSLLSSMLGAKIAVNKTADSYQKVIDESENNNRLWQQANNKLKAENRKLSLLMRAERSARIGWQQNAMSLTEVMMAAGETVETITEASHRMIARRQDDLALAFKNEQGRIERDVEAALEKERTGS